MHVDQTRHSVALIFPLHDHRGVALRALHAWQHQRKAVWRCEIVVVGSGQRKLTQRIRKDLAAADTLVDSRTLNEATLYNRGAEAATADWLLFTESHVIPAENALATLSNRLSHETVDAAVLGSSHETRSRFSEVDAALCQREHDGPMRTLGLWRCVGLRGFLVRRNVFEQLGRFQERYFRFAETVFALRLVAGNHRLADFHDVVVSHFDSDSIGEILFAMKMGRLGACRFHEDEPALAHAAFGSAAPPLSPFSVSPAQARRLWRQSLQRLRAGNLRAAWRLGRLALPTTTTALGGWWSQRLAASVRARVAHLRFLAMLHVSRRRCPATDAALLDHYALLRERCAEVGAVLHGQQTDRRIDPGEPVALDSLEASDLDRHGIGFFPTEVWQGEAYRWSQPEAAIQIRLPPNETVIRLDIRPTGQWGPRRPRFYLDGRPLPAASVREQDGSVEIHLGEHGSPGGPAVLSWTCRPFLPARAGLPDRRRLGVALISASASPKGSQMKGSKRRSAA